MRSSAEGGEASSDYRLSAVYSAQRFSPFQSLLAPPRMAISTKLKVAGALVAAAAGVVTVGVVKEKFGTKPRV